VPVPPSYPELKLPFVINVGSAPSHGARHAQSMQFERTTAVKRRELHG